MRDYGYGWEVFRSISEVSKLQVVQHTMFGAELVGTIVAAALLLKLPADDE